MVFRHHFGCGIQVKHMKMVLRVTDCQKYKFRIISMMKKIVLLLGLACTTFHLTAQEIRVKLIDS